MVDKRLERAYLDQLLTFLGLTAEGDIEASETPDFLLTLGGVRTGVEITQFHLPTGAGSEAYPARIGMQRIAVEQARLHFRANGGHALYVQVIFKSDDLSKSRAYELGPLIARALERTELPRSLGDPSASVSYGLMPSEVVSISAHGSVNGSDELWYPARAGWVAPVERMHVESEIARKAARLARIRPKCDCAWLVIVNDGFRDASPCELKDETCVPRFRSPFQRTLWLDWPGRVRDLSDKSAALAQEPAS